MPKKLTVDECHREATLLLDEYLNARTRAIHLNRKIDNRTVPDEFLKYVYDDRTETLALVETLRNRIIRWASRGRWLNQKARKRK